MHPQHAQVAKRLGEIGVGNGPVFPPVAEMGLEFLVDVTPDCLLQKKLFVGEEAVETKKVNGIGCLE